MFYSKNYFDDVILILKNIELHNYKSGFLFRHISLVVALIVSHSHGTTEATCLRYWSQRGLFHCS